MADLPAPQDIARRSFGTSRRGYEQQEVRGFLHEVSALVERLTRSETDLRQRAERAETKLGLADHPDEATLLEMLGSETTRVLTSAHEAAVEVRSKAEAAAAQMVADATTHATEIRSKATADVEAVTAAASLEAESMLEAARTALERRTAEAEAAAAGIRAEAEAAARLLREEAAAVLERARDEVRTLVAQAGDEAGAVLEAAREQGREMVAEAGAVRERVLRDLSERRKRARQQVEKLNAGRERLLQAYELVRRTTDEATNELSVSIIDARVAANAAARRVEDEPDVTSEQLEAEAASAGLIHLPVLELDDDEAGEYADAPADDQAPGPVSGEVPTIAGSAPPAEAAVAADPTSLTPVAPHEQTHTAVAEVPAKPTPDDRNRRKSRRKKGFDGVLVGELTVVSPPDPGEGVRILEAAPAPDTVEDPSSVDDGDFADADDDADAPTAAEVATDARATIEPEPVLEPEPEPVPEPIGLAEAEPVAAPEPIGLAESAPVAADDVFSRLRAETEAVDLPAAAEVADADAAASADDSDPAQDGLPDGSAVDPGPSEDDGPFAIRAGYVGPLEKEMARALKRALADEQNEVLDTLRREKPKGVDDLLPALDRHAARWSDASLGTLREAASAGSGSAAGVSVGVDDLAEELALALVGPLRERIDRGFAASDGNLDDIADRVRALYREWRGQRLAETSRHFTAAAYARGSYEAIRVGTKVTWLIDPSVGACPDCDDNVLAGAIEKGEEFPTGNTCAPAHPGCHCLVVAAPS